MAALQEEDARQAAEVARMRATTPAQLYADDLAAFCDALDARDADDAARAATLAAQRRRAGKGGAKAGAPRAKARPARHPLPTPRPCGRLPTGRSCNGASQVGRIGLYPNSALGCRLRQRRR